MATPRQNFARLAAIWSPEVQEALTVAVAQFADDALIEQVNAALEQGDIQEAFRLLQISPATLQLLLPSLRPRQRNVPPATRSYASGNAQLDRLIDLFTPEIRNAFLASIQDVKDNAILRDVQRAIEDGDPIQAFRALGFDDAAMRPLTQTIEKAFERGGVLTGERFPKYLRTPSGRAVFRFDVRNSRSEAWLRDQSSRLITQIQEDTRQNVRDVIFRNQTEGNNPRTTALDIVGRIDANTNQRSGGIIGLTTRQAGWVANVQRDLLSLDERYFSRELRDKRFDRTVAKAIRDGKPLPAETVSRLVTAYENNALRYRGEAIGRTEAIQALNHSEWEAHMQAVDVGALRKQDVERIWDSAGDRRVRPSHKALDGQKRGIDEPFVSPSGARMMHPGDTSLGAGGSEIVMCRCRVRLQADFLAQWEDADD